VDDDGTMTCGRNKAAEALGLEPKTFQKALHDRLCKRWGSWRLLPHQMGNSPLSNTKIGRDIDHFMQTINMVPQKQATYPQLWFHNMMRLVSILRFHKNRFQFHHPVPPLQVGRRLIILLLTEKCSVLLRIYLRMLNLCMWKARRGQLKARLSAKEATLDRIQDAFDVRSDRYAPKIVNYMDLWDKWEDLKLYFECRRPGVRIGVVSSDTTYDNVAGGVACRQKPGEAVKSF
jgi:hypothetical protein